MKLETAATINAKHETAANTTQLPQKAEIDVHLECGGTWAYVEIHSECRNVSGGGTQFSRTIFTPEAAVELGVQLIQAAELGRLQLKEKAKGKRKQERPKEDAKKKL